MAAGAISAIYIGATKAAAPTPTPPIKRKATKIARLFARAVPMPDKPNSAAQRNSTRRLPDRSARGPASRAPKPQPSRMELTRSEERRVGNEARAGRPYQTDDVTG